MLERRKKILIDPLQKRLFIRLVSYVVLLSVSIWAISSLWQSLAGVLEAISGSSLTIFRFLPVVLPFLMLVPIFIYDIIRFTHRFAGPLYRFRQTMRTIAQGQPVSFVKLRNGDMLMEMQDEFNDMLMALQEKGLVLIDSTNKTTDKQCSIGELNGSRMTLRENVPA